MRELWMVTLRRRALNYTQPPTVPWLDGNDASVSTLLVLGQEQTTGLCLAPSLFASSCLLAHLFSFCLVSPNLAPALCSPTLKCHTIATARLWVFPGGIYFLV